MTQTLFPPKFPFLKTWEWVLKFLVTCVLCIPTAPQISGKCIQIGLLARGGAVGPAGAAVVLRHLIAPFNVPQLFSSFSARSCTSAPLLLCRFPNDQNTNSAKLLEARQRVPPITKPRPLWTSRESEKILCRIHLSRQKFRTGARTRGNTHAVKETTTQATP